MAVDLLSLVYLDNAELLDEVRVALREGADPNQRTEYGESPLRVASNNGRFDVVEALLDAGADPRDLGWSKLFFDVAYASLAELEATLARAPELPSRDTWERTPWLLAVQSGDVAKAKALLSAGADPSARGRRGKTPLSYAVQGDHLDMLKWLLSTGQALESTNDSGETPLITAAVYGARSCARALIEAGANVFAQDSSPARALEETHDVEIVRLLLAEGENINDLRHEMRAKLTALDQAVAPDVSRAEYLRARHQRFGRRNPELVDEPFWQAMMSTGDCAYAARLRFEAAPSTSKEPVWCFDRFGMSITPLGDGRYVEIGGEHEDHYDPDFCIYNDVFVHDGLGRTRVFTYPRELFPPTDFHTATLVGRTIWVIGNLGYPADRRPGYTQVFALDVDSWSIERMETTGESPGWIGEHRATVAKDGAIVVEGGRIVSLDAGAQTYDDNDSTFALCLESLQWTRIRASTTR